MCCNIADETRTSSRATQHHALDQHESMHVPAFDALRDAGVANWLVDALNGTARDPGRSLSQVMTPVGDPVQVTNALARCRCHFIAADGNGRPRVGPLVDLLIAEIVDYCIPRSRIAEAHTHYMETNSTNALVRLENEARGLFSHLAKSGEGGELLLYLLLEAVLGLPQVLCKMPLKTNTQMHYHGVDGVHAKALPDGTLALYWGESKLYASVNAGITECFSSLAPLLLDDGTGSSRRDTMLLRDHLDTGDPALTTALKRYFTSSEPESNRVQIRGACLVGFSHHDCLSPFAADAMTIRTEVSTEIEKWRNKIGESIFEEKIESFEMEIFCIPMPSVQDFRDQMLAALGVPRDDA